MKRKFLEKEKKIFFSFRLNAPINEHKVRFVCISDTHEKLEEILPIIPDGDVLIHAGDFTNYGDVGEVIKFNAEIGLFFIDSNGFSPLLNQLISHNPFLFSINIVN